MARKEQEKYEGANHKEESVRARQRLWVDEREKQEGEKDTGSRDEECRNSVAGKGTQRDRNGEGE
jgi:hypothetical protein